MNLLPVGVVCAAAASSVPAGLRWLRVAQREHYESRSCGRFAVRWWLSTTPGNRVLSAIGVGGVLGSALWPPAALATAAVVAAGPIGLGLAGRTKPLAWTRRLRVLAGIWAAEQVVWFSLAAWAGTVLAPVGAIAGAVGAIGVPLLMDLALGLSSPIESKAAAGWVDKAAAKLKRLSPQVVGITGSYGKTTTKGYVAHLCAKKYSVLASPASFNNALGLARTVNEHLLGGTELLVAEMGAYRRGEIAALCEWMRPTIGVVTALGPVHLERFGSEEATAQAKSELPNSAEVAVVSQSHPALVKMTESLEATGKRVWRCSDRPDPSASVIAMRSGDRLLIEARPPVGAPHHQEVFKADLECPSGAPSNIACAVATALELGVDWDQIVSLIPTLPTAAHRLERQVSPAGVVVLDDTYNSNPAGARLALAALSESGSPDGRKVLVTPGMVELGPRQAAENEALGRYAAGVATHLVIVGLTNKRALAQGARRATEEGAKMEVILVSSRPKAVEWVREHLGEGDAVLYENDLPDHFP